ncbi:MAG: sensor histidine kinase [Solirubrobacterales bacterium]|nr:sensor histidine kinase [Solirubrobacterales bacterium]
MANFRARARTVDLLGRQQIAGIPTAVSELFKNAHDAYAERVEADYLADDSLFVLRDDGVGMSGRDFEQRWLVLGTESKVRGQRSRPEPRPGYLERPLLGEKGIGRLAIASIGPALLALMRPLSESERRQPIWGAFVHWGLFEVPGINLDDIEIPVERLGTKVPDADAVRELVDVFAANLKSLPKGTDAELIKGIREDLRAFDVDPRRLDRELPGPSLERDRSGVQFFVKPTHDSLDAAIRARDEDHAPELTTTLIGFMNTMLPDSDPPRIEPSFRIHRQGDVARDLIAPGEFFTAEQFKHADHHIKGRFDDDAVFRGTVRIYNQDPVDYEIRWPHGDSLLCGAFKLDLALVNPVEESSTMPATELAALNAKMEKLGGLYVYRDDVRILPYGRPDHDWLGIEQRRTKHAGRAFLSHRRMFGAVSLDGERSRALEEKAGREGFRDNRAYRQFRDLLIFFLRSVVSDFFTGAGAKAYMAAQEDLKAKAKARREREKRAAERRAAFERALVDALTPIEAGGPRADVDEVVADLDAAIADALRSDGDQGEAIAAAERRAHAAITGLIKRYTVTPPTGFGLDSELRATWAYYRTLTDALEDDVWTPARNAVGERAGAALAEARSGPTPAQRLRALVVDTSDRARDALDGERRTTGKALERTTSTVRAVMDRSLRDFDQVSERSIAELAAHADSVNGDLDDRRREAELPILEAADRGRAALAAVAAQLRAIRATPSGELEISDLDALDALEEEVLEWRERGAAELELAQLGMGIQIVGHEFNASVGAVRGALRQLKPWADANEGLQRPYRDLRTGFEHLEGYLRLLAPLQRRLNRRRSRIRGREIADYVESLFERRLEKGSVGLRVTDEFAAHEVVAFRSTMYPVFTALVDNALYWVGERKGDRWIELDAADEAILVSNSGPPIPGPDRERVFEMGFTRKPGGQGMGLFVVHEALRTQGFDIDIVDTDDHWAWRIRHSDDE